MLQAIDARAARRWALTALAALGQAREQIDAMNVYPVPDGDTGTNLYLTLEAAAGAASALPTEASLRELAEAFAQGALLGARGNSGVIAAQLIRGWADVLAVRGVLDAAAARQAARQADAAAWDAVADPVEGTMLSVSRAAALAAAEAGPGLPEVVQAMASAAAEALARTPDQLETLRRAGVLDAGGQGLLILIQALAEVVHGGSVQRRGRGHRQAPLPIIGPPGEACPDPAGEGRSYEVMYLLDAPEDRVRALRRELSRLGDSVVVIGGSELWQVHVHVDDAGAAVEAGMAAGRPHQVRISYLETVGPQTGAPHPGSFRPTALSPTRTLSPTKSESPSASASESPFASPLGSSSGSPSGSSSGSPSGSSSGSPSGSTPFGSALSGSPARTRLVACAAGPGLADLFTRAGAVVVEASPGRRPDTSALLQAIRGSGGGAVVVLPNDPQTQLVAEAAAAVARREGIRVTVLPTRAQVQGLAAVAVHDPSRGLDDDVVRMSSAAAAARDGAVTIAVRDAMTTAGPCRTGDALGVVQGDFVIVGSDLGQVTHQVLDRLLSGGGELVTMVTGTAADPELVRAATEHLRRTRFDVEVHVLDGGQERYPLLLGVE